MFLSKEAFDGDGGFSNSAASTSSEFMRPMARPSSSYGRPGTSGSTLGTVEELPEDTATPSSAATLRQKMMLQRQRTLQKQKTGGGGAVMSGTMVMANDSIASSGHSPAAAQSPLASRASAAAPFAGSLMESLPTASAVGSRTCAAPEFSPVSELEARINAMAQEDEEEEGNLVMPAPTATLSPREMKAEEAKRRANLAQSLDERGLSPIFDPSPATGPSAGPQGPKTSFLMEEVLPADVKNFLLNPVPKGAGMIECRIIREKGGLNKLFPKYILESDAGVFMMTAKKQKHNKTSNYAVTMSKTDDCSKESEFSLGKLRSNFLGLEFVAYGVGLNPKKIEASMPPAHAVQMARQEHVAITYSSSMWGTKPRGPRKMTVIFPRVQPNGERVVCRTMNPDKEGLLALQKTGGLDHLVDCYHNKPPKWNDQVGAFVLNFNKRVTQASVKNFQLTSADDPDTVYLQFGRVDKDKFNMDFRHPFSPLQAFTICLSSFDYKLCCE